MLSQNERRKFWIALVVGALGGCLHEDPLPDLNGTAAGQVVISGPLRGAHLSIDQLEIGSGEVRAHVTDATTDDDGRFDVKISLYSGLLRITARGGSFVDVATGATIQLDATDQISSLVEVDLLEHADDLLVSPIGHLVDARARWRLQQLGAIEPAVVDATDHLHRHFGNADWSRLRLVGLDEPATSPTEAVRAALVHTSLSYLARDIADQAGASPQEVNVYSLTKLWAEDLTDRGGVFDGNDGNERSPGSGLQLGLCPPVSQPCELPSGCDVGACRALCDLYVGTPRALLGAVMTKVIRDPAANKTGLNINDTLAIARACSENIDPDLFGDECRETLDRIAPSLTFQTPEEGRLVRGELAVKVTAVDDIDPNPVAAIVGYPDADGDPTNATAQALIDTTALADGDLEIIATGRDMAGNTATSTRKVLVDNTPPELTLETAGFFVDTASTWWTGSATPLLRGAVTDSSPVTIKAIMAGGTEVAGTVTGTSWSISTQPGDIEAAGTQVTIVATDRAGNQRSIVQRIRPDASPPALSFRPSTVNDEGGDQVTFATDESPIHTHGGAPIDLSTSTGCSSITKFSYLLGASSPTFVTEMPGRNPIAYQFVAADDGVGIVANSTQYRVSRREAGGGSTVVLDWTSTGTGTPIGSGAQLFGVALLSELVTGLATTEATYDVEFRATDRLSRTSTTTRCVEVRLRAPPLHFTTGGAPTTGPYALNALNLAPGAAYDQLAARLLNNTATGASLIDQPVINGTTETVYLTVSVAKPTSVDASQKFVVRNYETVTDTSTNCDTNPTACSAPQPFPSPTGTGYISNTITTAANTLSYPVALFELNSSGVPTTEIPCLAPCPHAGSVFTFAVPPRSPTGAARRFVAMTMIGQVTALWPRDATYDETQPFGDNTIADVHYTGKVRFSSSGCTRTTLINGVLRCTQRTARTQYRALTYAALSFASDTKSNYATSPTATLPPLQAAPQVVRAALRGWQTAAGALP